MFRTSNPTLNENTFEKYGSLASVGGRTMTLGGTIAKTSFLLLLLIVSAAVSWQIPSLPVLAIGFIGGLALSFLICFKPETSPWAAPLYAILKGAAVGVISVLTQQQLADTKYSGAVPLAVTGTFMVLGAMLFLYGTRIIKVTQTFIGVVVGATMAICLTYAVTLLLSLFWPGVMNLPIYSSSPIGIGFSIFAIIIAALNLALDFHLIETGVERGAPKVMEWYCGFGLLVTLVWIYIELLNLLRKLAGNR
ncbi:MAG: hypothetical protein HONBIEJF_00483 [Fimbriimonadaceae bacterium]|nr:hypothetical protein [Fimbriimonadaceae bacterium]